MRYVLASASPRRKQLLAELVKEFEIIPSQAEEVVCINNNIEKNISLDRLARRFFVSKYHLCRAFKTYSGISVHAYINRKRIIYAKRLIESGVTASQAAERVGFGDYSAFYRAYIKVVGKSPTA